MSPSSWLASLITAAAQLLSRGSEQAALSTDVSFSPINLGSSSISIAPRYDDLVTVGRQTQPELSDMELLLMVGQNYSTGEKRAEPKPYQVQLCEFTEFTGGGMLTRSWRAKFPGCSCERNEMKYGTANDRGTGFARMSHDSYVYLARSCSHSMKVYP